MSETTKETPKLFDKITQVMLPTLTILGFLLTSIKKPQFGLISNLVAEIFWFYAAWQAWKKANQIGIFITTAIIAIILMYGVVNYWFL